MAKRPTQADLSAAAGNTMPDLIAPKLRVLFCGINPSLYSAYTGYHFARPGNRFWPTLYASGFTDRLLKPEEANELLAHGLGITSFVDRATTAADELSNEELITGGQRLLAKLQEYKPRTLAILGITAYRTAFNRPQAKLGNQEESLGETDLWVLPNPSGLNAHYKPADLAQIFREFRLAIDARNV
jgi:TDG/mug DNA glycosylase family protein